VTSLDIGCASQCTDCLFNRTRRWLLLSLLIENHTKLLNTISWQNTVFFFLSRRYM